MACSVNGNTKDFPVTSRCFSKILFCFALPALLAAGCNSKTTTTPGTASGGTAKPAAALSKPPVADGTGGLPVAAKSTTTVASVTPAVTKPTTTAPSTSNSTSSAVEAWFKPYEKQQGVSGSIKSVGSDSMNNLMTFWLEGLKKEYPSVTTEVEGKGSSSAPPALISGTAHFGPMSRPMKDSEIAEFEKSKGYKPTALPTAIDVLGVYVHKDNPIASLTVQQVDAIFSKSRKAGGGKDIVTWGDLGLTGEWAAKPIQIYGRNSASGTYGFFKEHVLLNGDFKDSVKEQPGSSAVVQAVATDKFGIGYSGIGYKTADVKAVPLAANTGEAPVEATAKNGIDGTYPLTRDLLVYMDYKPGSTLDPLRREFVRFVYSRDGQEGVVKDGYIPATQSMAEDALKSVGAAK